jgi:glucoamylase
MSVSPTASASDGNSTVQVTMPNGDLYFHRYDHDKCGESMDCSGWLLRREHGLQRLARQRSQSFRTAMAGSFRRARRVRLANGRAASVYLRSMADAANDGYFVPERHSASAGSLCCDVRCDATLSIQRHFPAFSGIRGGVSDSIRNRLF